MTARAPLTDVHTHLAPGVPAFALATAGLTRDKSGLLVAPEGPIGPPDLYHPERLMAWLHRVGLERALVSIPPPLYRQGLPAAATRDWVQAINDGLKEMLAGAPELLPLGYLPLDQPEVALSELERLLDVGGFAGVTAASGGRSISLADGRHDAMFSTVAAAGLPLLMHPAMSPDPRMSDLYLHNLVGNPTETALAGAELLLGGALQRHPDLRIALVHAGGTLPALVGRLQRGIDTKRPGLTRDCVDLRSEARGLWADTLCHDEHALTGAEAMVGEGHLLLGSDWPFPMGSDDPLSALDHLPSTFRSRIATANARDFLGEGSPERGSETD